MKKLIFGLALLISLFFADHAFAYTVGEGDTMSEIAQEHGMTLKQLATANPQIEDLDLIFVGQTIHTKIKKYSDKLLEGIDYSYTEESTDEAVTENVIDEQSVHNVASASTEISLSEADIDLLARIVRAEAQTEPFEGKVAVAAVVLNRVESPLFPDSIKEVIYQRGQFQPVSNGQINRPADDESIKAVYAALTDMRDIVGNSLFFYNPDIATSRWLDSRRTTFVIGQHVFKI
ncbi:cell wall hydrolase [Fredinandcohnia humi]